MKFLIDLQSCQSGSRFGGIGRYSLALAKAMIYVGTEHEFYVLLNKNLPGQHEVRNQLKSILPQQNIVAIDLPINVSENLTLNQGRIEQTRIAELIREKFIVDLNPDVVHVSSLIEGFGDDVVTSVGLLFPASKTIVTLYDLIPLVERDKYLSNWAVEKHYFNKISHMGKAGILLAISDYSKNEGVDIGKFLPDSVINVSSAVDQKFKPRNVMHARRNDIFNKYSITKKFLMYVGSFDSRKNQENLIRAFAKTSDEIRNCYQLVIVGNGWNDIYQRLRNVAADAGLPNDAVLFLGHVDDETLIDLYNLCALLVFPSLREGFGLPVLEAMSCGVPAIGSNTTSVPEVLGRDDATFDPKSISSISAKIEEVLTNGVLYRSLKEHALIHASSFSWEISAAKALGFIEKTMNKRAKKDENFLIDGQSTYDAFLEKIRKCDGFNNSSDDFLKISARAIAHNEVLAKCIDGKQLRRAKIGWITTWNERCGIASYSKNLIESVSHPAHVFAPSNGVPVLKDESNVTRCWKVGRDDFIALNAAIIDAGVQVLSVQLNYGFFDFTLLSSFLIDQKNRGLIVTVTLHATIDPPVHILNRKLSELHHALNVCDAVLVHSLDDVRNLANIGVCDNVVLFPQGVVNPVQEKNKKKCKTIKIATYGFALPHKGLEQVIEGFDMLVKKGVEVEMEMVNASYSDAASGQLIANCKKMIDDFGLSSRIRMVTDYLSDQDTLSRLSKADIVVFAYQKTSESSSAAVRMGLASGALVAVTPLRIFDDISDCVYTLPGIHPENIASGVFDILGKIFNDSDDIGVIRDRAARWIECNRFDRLGGYYSGLVNGFLESIL